MGEEFDRQLKARLSKTDDGDQALPEEYRKILEGGPLRSSMVRGLDRDLLRKTKEKIAKEQGLDIESAYQDSMLSPDVSSKKSKVKVDQDGDVSMSKNMDNNL